MKKITDCDIVDGFDAWMSDEGISNQESLAILGNECSTQSTADGADDDQPAIKANLTRGVKKSGRNPGNDTKLLNNFRCKKNSKKAPKKEYVRCQLIRNHKKMNRLIKVNSFPDKTMGKFNKDNGEAWRLYGILKDIYNKNQNVLEVESQTESGPMTDGKSKRNTNPAQKSFNTEYIRFYFRNEPVKQSFFYFVELVFSDPNPEILCEKFGFCCCLSQTPQEHSYKCCKNWEELKTYVQIKMLEDLEIAAWKPNDLVPKIKESPEEDIFGEEAFIQFNADPEETNIEEIDLEGTELSSFGI